MLYGIGGAVLTTLLLGIPTDVVPTPFFMRMSPVRVQDYVFLGMAALLGGLLVASYALPQSRACSTEQGKTTLGGFLSFFAIGCPVCNKVVVLLLGTSGALRFFEPVQPILGVLSLVFLGLAVWVRWRPVLAPPLGTPRNA
jgi:hypothetical protein